MYIIQYEDIKELECFREKVLSLKIKPLDRNILNRLSLPYITKKDLDLQAKIVNKRLYNIYLKVFSDLKNIYIKKLNRPYRQFNLVDFVYLVEYFQQLCIELDIDKVLELDETLFLDKIFSYKDVLNNDRCIKLIEKRYKWLKSQ